MPERGPAPDVLRGHGREGLGGGRVDGRVGRRGFEDAALEAREELVGGQEREESVGGARRAQQSMEVSYYFDALVHILCSFSLKKCSLHYLYHFFSCFRYLWPLIHYHKFIAKCIKKLKRNGIDVKSHPSAVCRFLRQEVCNVSDHLAFMSKYDSEEWTSALSHFKGWADHDPTVEVALRSLVASQRLVGLADTADAKSMLVRGQIEDSILKAMQVAKEEAKRDAYDYKDAPTQQLQEGGDILRGGVSGDGSVSAEPVSSPCVR